MDSRLPIPITSYGLQIKHANSKPSILAYMNKACICLFRAIDHVLIFLFLLWLSVKRTMGFSVVFMPYALTLKCFSANQCLSPCSSQRCVLAQEEQLLQTGDQQLARHVLLCLLLIVGLFAVRVSLVGGANVWFLICGCFILLSIPKCVFHISY